MSNKVINLKKEMSIFFAAPPTIDDGLVSPNLNITLGATLTMDCNAEGLPPPLIHWVKDGRRLPVNGPNHVVSTSGMLTVQRVSVDDEGRYVCVASNIAGNSTKTIYVSVQGTTLCF